MILTLDDQTAYLPDLAELSEEALLGAIAATQVLVESAKGANRPLEVTQFQEILPLPSSGIVRLAYLPLILSPAPTVEIREVYSNQDWQLMDSSQYAIDQYNGQIRLSTIGNFFPGFQRYQTSRYSRKPYEPNREFRLEVRIRYNAGFNFTQVNNPVIELMKRSFAAIVSLREAGKPALSGVANFRLENEYSAAFSPDATMNLGSDGAAIDGYMSLFRRYRPRRFF